MTTELDIRTLREERLGLSRVQLGQLLGVHPLTVYRWERGNALPPHQRALLESFQHASKAKPNIGETVAAALLTAGVVVALYLLLEAAVGKGSRR